MRRSCGIVGVDYSVCALHSRRLASCEPLRTDGTRGQSRAALRVSGIPASGPAPPWAIHSRQCPCTGARRRCVSAAFRPGLRRQIVHHHLQLDQSVLLHVIAFWPQVPQDALQPTQRSAVVGQVRKVAVRNGKRRALGWLRQWMERDGNSQGATSVGQTDVLPANPHIYVPGCQDFRSDCRPRGDCLVTVSRPS